MTETSGSQRVARLDMRGGRPYGARPSQAKQTKVARELKYQTHETDLERLARELRGDPPPQAVDETDEDDPYADYVDPSRTAR
jgi:hypothetical protein